MTQEEIQKAIKAGKAEFIKQEQPEQKLPEFDDSVKFVAILEMLRRPKYHLTDHPTFTPKTFLEQIQFVDDGTDQFIDIYINGNWYSFPGTLIT